MTRITKSENIGIQISGEYKTEDMLSSAFWSITFSTPLPRATVINIEGALPIKVAIT